MPSTKRTRHVSPLLCGIQTIKELIRFDHWWYSKMPPLLAVGYLCILQFGLGPGQSAVLLPSLFFSIACVAAYGHVINDIFDIESDRRAGKPNAIERLRPGQRGLICAALVGLGYLPALAVSYSPWGYLLLALNYLWPTIYSVPGIRLKERGLAGVLCDAAGAHLTPTLLVLAVLSHRIAMSGHLMVFSAAALIWSSTLGIKGILNHQIADRENDRASGTVTLATRAAPGQIERFLPRYNLFVELPVNAAFVFIVSRVCPLAVLGLSIYCLVEALKYRLGFQFALNSDPRNTRASFPFVNDFFYYLWLPLSVALQLALTGPVWALVPLVLLALFRRTALLQIRDLSAVARVSRSHIGHRCAQFRLKRQMHPGEPNGS
ncbi:UbiA prenyltransferase [Cupriavidus basilensis OR16]|uniref:UbiA prenyltransferase n=1 Tax=Cupriavidus basilensis OR16 TaxID=1127483 RepID=H1SG20_9BURK|nr:UbiA family prenyltransferase [Cupriavidus basilensis]EHP38506.1 UbiA prenyltransferase [Cupriavidus basilensis OR16]